LRRLEEGNDFIYYAPAHPSIEDENRNQAWKDSGDAIVDEAGRIRIPPLALAEIQGYAYLALNEAVELLKLVDSNLKSETLQFRARRLKQRFNQCFWLEEEKFYALALDQNEVPLRSKASNIGHCLGTGILESTRVHAVVEALMQDDLFSGWGIRTLSSQNPGYDAFSYHRGSVWPVENAIIADGMSKLGFHDEAHRIISGQLNLAAMFQHLRLPEVFGGQPRDREHPAPGIYNFANLLQTWSVSAISQFIQAILGIRPKADEGVLYLNPFFPDWISWVTLKNLRVGNCRLSLHFWKEGIGSSHTRTRVKVLEKTGEIRVVTLESLPRPLAWKG
jgi:glycogen debranching enzyme